MDEAENPDDLSAGRTSPESVADNNEQIEETCQAQQFELIEPENDEDKHVSPTNLEDPFADSSNESSKETQAEASSSKKSDSEGVDVQDIDKHLDPKIHYIKIMRQEAKKTCVLCKAQDIVKYYISFEETTTFLCKDKCLRTYLNTHDNTNMQEYFSKFYCPVQVDAKFKYVRQCKQCARVIPQCPAFIWEGFEFCKEHCLYRYQFRKGQLCSECKKPVGMVKLGKYCVRFGLLVRQFCSTTCLDMRKKKMRICAYCQTTMRSPKCAIGNKHFCDDICKGFYENLQSSHKLPFLINRDDARCYVCKKADPIEIEFDYHRSSFYFCSQGCFIVFKFIQNCELYPKQCHMCDKYVLPQYLETYVLHTDDSIIRFCSEVCQNIHLMTNRCVLPCVWCKVRKYNFDLIKNPNFMSHTIHVCSLVCFNNLKRSIETIKFQRKNCVNCLKELGFYEVKLSNGSSERFCSNSCITSYQNRKAPLPLTRTNKRLRNRARHLLPEKAGPLPVITSVCSLASNKTTFDLKIRKLIVIQLPALPERRNAWTSVEPDKEDQAVQTSSPMEVHEVQTEGLSEKFNVIPILIPIYVPSPFPLWRAPFPTPLPFPLFIPCPVFIPLTRKTAASVMKEVKSVQVKEPANPIEADLLMMAELVAAEKEKKDGAAEAASDQDDNGAGDSFSPRDNSNSYEDDMIQMALTMATGYQDSVDLEGALTANKITPQQAEEEAVDDPEIKEKPVIKVKKRLMKLPKRVKQLTEAPVDSVPEEPTTPAGDVQKLDVNMCLKYTFGVNAWKQWVTMKNDEIERSSRRLKPFKTEILQQTADELNYALCLFVEEVRKPNGSEYAPDTIYYLCLGIQQYLYENNRIDNIFCDPYFEKFTDCLDKICRKFSALYSDSHYIVTRVEEEHLWESKQLGAHSPHVLLSTLMFFNTKHYNLVSVEEHAQLAFSNIMKHWKRNQNPPVKDKGSRNVLLRYYPPQKILDAHPRKRKVYEQQESRENPLRCPVKLYEFYLSKCPESVKTRTDEVFYLMPERSCVPDSPVWYSTSPLDRLLLEKMLHRVRMVKEINVALLTS